GDAVGPRTGGRGVEVGDGGHGEAPPRGRRGTAILADGCAAVPGDTGHKPSPGPVSPPARILPSMECPACRATVPDGARFCSECGHALSVVGDERRVVTVLFADLVGFTTLSETTDPEQVKNLVDRCFQRLVAVIETYGGKVDKIIGDAIHALFRAPLPPGATPE